MTECQVCGTESAFLYQCSDCGEQFCADHVEPADHDCPAAETSTGPSLSARQLLLSGAFFLALAAGLAAFLFVLGPAGPIGAPGSTDGAPATTTAEPVDGRAVLAAVNERRTASNRSAIGYHRDLADLAENRSWSPPADGEQTPVRVSDAVACTEIETLEYEGDPSAAGREGVAGAVVDAWESDADSRAVLLALGWDLGGVAVDRDAETDRVRLVVCNATD